MPERQRESAAANKNPRINVVVLPKITRTAKKRKEKSRVETIHPWRITQDQHLLQTRQKQTQTTTTLIRYCIRSEVYLSS